MLLVSSFVRVGARLAAAVAASFIVIRPIPLARTTAVQAIQIRFMIFLGRPFIEWLD
jgi:uncharacterized protein (DUF697 family)